jgi:hypothetical protein
MSALVGLLSVARGERPDGQVLPPCRLEGFGSEFFGEEAIVGAFRATPFSGAEDLTAIIAGRHLAIFAGDEALVADVYGDNVGRIWRLGPGEAQESEPNVGVPFDADLMQSRGDLAFRAEDHPALSATWLPQIERMGRLLSRDWDTADDTAPYRARSFLVRAFSDEKRSVGLFALHTMGGGATRTIGFTYVAGLVEHEDPANSIIIRDVAGSAARETMVWRPRVE